jgi:hypothetical protein
VIASGGFGDTALETVELNIVMGDDLIGKTRDLAVRYFGDDNDESLARVLQLALAMRCLWSQSVQGGQHEVDEVVSNWEFSESSVSEENTGTISSWLFRR